MITLPPILFSRPTSIGKIWHEIRPSATVAIVERYERVLTARRTIPVLVLSNGERIMLVERTGVARPDNVDAVLQRRPDGSYKWLWHRQLDEFEREVEDVGLPRMAERVRESWKDNFLFRAETRLADGSVAPGSEGLRPPQLGALYSVGAHWTGEIIPATVVMPTGTGKTETMLATLAAYANGPFLIVVPWDLLRTQTARKFISFGLLRQLKVIPDEMRNPIVGVVTKRPKHIHDLALFQSCNVIIATADTVSRGTAAQFIADIASRCWALVLDEAHHVAAASWNEIKSKFMDKRVVQFTATPFRRDGMLVDGKVIYTYPLAAAQRDGYFKKILFLPVMEVGTARADRAIADKAITQLRNDAEQGFDHLVMARCANIGRAAALETIYKELAPELNPVVINYETADAIARIGDLRAGRARIAICVDMLGEGFDLPQLKIAALHDRHRSLAILLQFAGRFTRVAGRNIGDAKVIANLADPVMSGALDRLYSEDADWNVILSELSSNAARAHAELIDFLSESQRLDEPYDDDVAISQQLLRPIFSTLTYHADQFDHRLFYEAIESDRHVQAVWFHQPSSTLYFVTRNEPKVRWSQAKNLRDREWSLFILHYDASMGLLFLSSTDRSSLFPKLAEAVTGKAELLSGENIFRSLGNINRLVFQSIGMKKHGRRNLSFAMYTGEDVATALGLVERSGSVKNNVSGMGWSEGGRVTIGCSFKGRVWSRDQGSITEFISWCKGVGAKLLDDSISVEEIISNVLIPVEVDALPDKRILGIDWPAEMLGLSEERISFESESGKVFPMYLVDLEIAGVRDSSVTFRLSTDEVQEVATFVLTVGGSNGFAVEQQLGERLFIRIGSRTRTLADYFSDFPPLFRFVDLSELDGNLLISPKDPRELRLRDGQFEIWDWAGTDITQESLWKNGALRRESVQWKVARHFIDAGFAVVFDDDGAGEAADLICLDETEDEIKLTLIHCKFSETSRPGERVSDVVEVSSQAVRSAKWKWRFNDLGKHIMGREERLATDARQTRFLAGNVQELNSLIRASRFKPIKASVLVVQPGLSYGRRAADQEMVLASAASYLQQTIGCELAIICSP